jgi:hypothetical protein
LQSAAQRSILAIQSVPSVPRAFLHCDVAVPNVGEFYSFPDPYCIGRILR